MLAMLLHVEKHDDVVRTRVLENEAVVVSNRELDHVPRGSSFELSDLA